MSDPQSTMLTPQDTARAHWISLRCEQKRAAKDAIYKILMDAHFTRDRVRFVMLVLVDEIDADIQEYCRVSDPSDPNHTTGD